MADKKETVETATEAIAAEKLKEMKNVLTEKNKYVIASAVAAIITFSQLFFFLGYMVGKYIK